MSALAVVEPGPPPADPLTARFDDLILELGGYMSDGSPAVDGVRIDRIARLEKLRAATAALQAAETVRFARSQVAEQLAQDVHPNAIGRGIGDQIALACKISPSAGSQRLGVPGRCGSTSRKPSPSSPRASSASGSPSLWSGKRATWTPIPTVG